LAALRAGAQSASWLARKQGPARPAPKNAKGAPEDALYKLERAKHLPLELEDLVMKAHFAFPSVVETLRSRQHGLKLVNCLATL
jgi:hypothetical protein